MKKEMCSLESAGSSSGSSSPQSNTSSDDQNLGDTSVTNVAGFQSKPIYNFSIPDTIKHDSRQSREDFLPRASSEALCSASNLCVASSQSRRKRQARAGSSHVTVEGMHVSTTDSDRPRTRKRQRLESELSSTPVEPVAGPNIAPQIIDLTELDNTNAEEDEESHQGHRTSLSDSEVDSVVEGSSLHHSESARSFAALVRDKERYRRQLQDSHDRMQYFMYDNIYRPTRPRRPRRRSRSSSHLFAPCSIISDGPLVTEPMLQAQAVPVIMHTSESETLPPVITLDEDDSNTGTESRDREIVQRMALDPSFSPPYMSPHQYVIKPSRRHHSRSRHHRLNRDLFQDETMSDFERRIQSIQRRSRDHLEEARRISQQTQDRLARLQETMYRLRHRQHQILNSAEAVLSGVHSAEHIDRIDRERAQSSEQTTDENRTVPAVDDADDVQFIGEWRPMSFDYFQSSLDGDVPRLASANGPSIYPHHFRRHIPVPDFLTPLMSTVLGPSVPRLHHFGEDYEALWNLAERIGPAKPRGLSKPECDQIPAFRYNSTKNSPETNTKCVVCMSDYANREKLRRLPCSHDFHARCIDKWLKSNKTCPVCRDEVKIKTD